MKTTETEVLSTVSFFSLQHATNFFTPSREAHKDVRVDCTSMPALELDLDFFP